MRAGLVEQARRLVDSDEEAAALAYDVESLGLCTEERAVALVLSHIERDARRAREGGNALREARLLLEPGDVRAERQRAESFTDSLRIESGCAGLFCPMAPMELGIDRSLRVYCPNCQTCDLVLQYDEQTRAADEALTTRAVCGACGHAWSAV